MEKYDLLVIGFGKAGKTLAGKFAKLGKKVALIEKDSSMYGGTCINIACIPTKTLIQAAEENKTFQEAMQLKDAVTSRLNQKNKAVLEMSGATLYNGSAYFRSNHVVDVRNNGQVETIEAQTIIINTGATSNAFPIPGLLESNHVYDSTGIQRLDKQPARLGIIGGGNIGLEFASLYAKLGTKVTVFDTAPAILSRSDETVAKLAQEYMEEDGITFKLSSQILKVENKGEQVAINLEDGVYDCDAVLYALGRKPAVDQLGLENTDIALTERGAIKVNDYLQTTVPTVYAVGDVHGGLQFTYTSLDDSRIVYNHLTKGRNYSLKDRKNVPTSTFINPPLSEVGMTEKMAKEEGIAYKSNELLVAGMPRGHVDNKLRGIFKVIVSTENDQILGASLFSQESHELINMIKMAMDNKIPYTYFKENIFTHPTMAENLNDVFNF
ncbi:FAD-containing oxidoreductase [Streptococcus iniae]|nr:pyridine nucleotide-disulfide oxidoreductase [Streptococcus iniae]